MEWKLFKMTLNRIKYLYVYSDTGIFYIYFYVLLEEMQLKKTVALIAYI